MKIALILASTLHICVAITSLSAAPFPLPATATVPTDEANAPFVLPDGFSQHLIVDRFTLLAQGLPSSLSNWDMLSLDPSGRYIFVPAEVGSGAGVFRYDMETGRQLTMLVGNESGVRASDPKKFNPLNEDFARIDPATYTPWGTVITGEETTGGRIFEIFDPLKLPDGFPSQILRFLPNPVFQVKWQSGIPAVSHEGLRFDENHILYFIDEDNSGSIYKFVPFKPGKLDRGQSFVLCVDRFTGVASENWNSATNITTVRSGAARWIAITDAQGNALTAANPYAFGDSTGGRTAADEIGGTPFGRPEDMSIGRLANGHQAVYIAITSERLVIAIELVSATNAVVHDFVRSTVTINEATDAIVGGGSAGLNNPDNMEVAADGTVYIVEDANPGDIWRATDANGDGVAESIGRWVSLGVAGSEPTGLISDPNDPKRFFVSIQHPSSGNDAIWAITVP